MFTLLGASVWTPQFWIFQNWRTFSVPHIKFQIIHMQNTKACTYCVNYTCPETKYCCRKSGFKILFEISNRSQAPPKMTTFSCPTFLMTNLHVKYNSLNTFWMYFFGGVWYWWCIYHVIVKIVFLSSTSFK